MQKKKKENVVIAKIEFFIFNCMIFYFLLDK